MKLYWFMLCFAVLGLLLANSLSQDTDDEEEDVGADTETDDKVKSKVHMSPRVALYKHSQLFPVLCTPAQRKKESK